MTDCIDRMGYRLQGPPLPHARGHDIVSDGTVMGAIQIPGDGQPIVLMADRQPTGGYPKIGTVIRADLPALAQARPGTIVRFSSIAVEEAVVELELAMTSIAKARTLDPRRSVLNTDLLLSGHCSGGVVDAMRNPFQDAS